MTIDRRAVIDYDRTKSELTNLVSKQPDLTYRPPADVRASDGSWIRNKGTCYYVHEDKVSGSLTQGCIVGVWLNVFHFVGLRTLHQNENNTADELIISLELDRVLKRHVTEDAIRLLRTVQSYQDKGTPWGEALSDAIHAVESDTDGDDPDDADGYGDYDY